MITTHFNNKNRFFEHGDPAITAVENLGTEEKQGG